MYLYIKMITIIIILCITGGEILLYDEEAIPGMY